MQRNTACILGVYVDRDGMDKAFEKAASYLGGDGAKAIYTPNPEIINAALKNEEYRDVLNRADMVVPDGIGVVYASKIVGQPVAERVAGYDLTCKILDFAAQKGTKVFIYGGKPGVADAAAQKLSEKGVNIVGTMHGYQQDENAVIEAINEAKAEFVLVCLGAPKQEIWIDKNKDKTCAKLFIGAGGSVDVIAGNTKRAPKFFIKLNLEWFYRLCKQPSRIGRMMQLPVFMLKVIVSGRRYLK